MKLLSLLAPLFLGAIVLAQSPVEPLQLNLNVQVEAPILDMDAMIVALEAETEAPATDNNEPVFWTRWYCLYWDGTRVYNMFRSYRTSTEVSNYFRGFPGSHDCDAWYIVGGRTRYPWCTRTASWFASVHRGIRYIGRG